MARVANAPAEEMSASWQAPTFLVVGVVAASFSPILIRYADDAEPLAISFWRCAAGAVLLLPWAGRGLGSLSSRHKKLCAISGAFLAVHFATWITSLELTSVASSVLLVSTTPVFIALVAPWIVGERLTQLGWLGIALAFGGTIAIAGLDFGGASLSGNALALAGGATVAGYMLAGRVARRDLPILSYAVATYGVAAVLLAVVCVAGGVPLWGYPGATWLAIAGIVAGPQLLGHTVLNLVLSKIDATTVSVSLMAEPIIATALAAWLFSEVPTLVFYPGGLAILAGIYIVSTNQRAAELPPT